MAATVQSLIHFWKNFDLPQLQVGNFSSFLLFYRDYEYLELPLCGFSKREFPGTASHVGKNIDRLSADIDASLNPLVELKEEYSGFSLLFF